MQSRYAKLYSAIATLEANTREPELIESIPGFPFKAMYPGQKEIIDRAKAVPGCCITSHTGMGKTACFLTLTRGKSAIVIEPRKFLQEQCSAGYFHDFVLYGRSGYVCPLSYAGTAASAYCLAKEDCCDTIYPKTCKNHSGDCLNGTKQCKVFLAGGEYKQYPCEYCEYNDAVRRSVEVLRGKGTVICNFGNFWKLVRHAEIVVVDEADLFFKEISNAMPLKFSKPKDGVEDVHGLLEREVRGLKSAAKDKNPDMRYRATNLLFAAEFLKANAELCFTYQRKDRIYVEIDPRNTNVLKNKLFGKKNVVIVSATPGQFDLPSYSASIHQRCGIYFAPVGNLTSRNLKANPHIMNSAGRAIKEISEYMGMIYDADKMIVHCGNLGTHASSLFQILGDENCILHESGKLAETIEKYKVSPKRYLLVASAEYGLDASFCKLQFVLKFPYPHLDERMNTLKRAMGPEFAGYYTGEARTRIIQTAGRNVRGYNDFGITIMLDSKIIEDYQRNIRLYPEWFRERVNPKVF